MPSATCSTWHAFDGVLNSAHLGAHHRKAFVGADNTGDSRKECNSVPAAARERRKKLVSWCFKPSQPQRITSGLKETFTKRYIVERANRAEIRPE